MNWIKLSSRLEFENPKTFGLAQVNHNNLITCLAVSARVPRRASTDVLSNIIRASPSMQARIAKAFVFAQNWVRGHCDLAKVTWVTFRTLTEMSADVAEADTSVVTFNIRAIKRLWKTDKFLCYLKDAKSERKHKVCLAFDVAYQFHTTRPQNATDTNM